MRRGSANREQRSGDSLPSFLACNGYLSLAQAGQGVNEGSGCSEYVEAHCASLPRDTNTNGSHGLKAQAVPLAAK